MPDTNRELDREMDAAILNDSKHEADIEPFHPITDGDQYIGGKPLAVEGDK